MLQGPIVLFKSTPPRRSNPQQRPSSLPKCTQTCSAYWKTTNKLHSFRGKSHLFLGTELIGNNSTEHNFCNICTSLVIADFIHAVKRNSLPTRSTSVKSTRQLRTAHFSKQTRAYAFYRTYGRSNHSIAVPANRNTPTAAPLPRKASMKIQRRKERAHSHISYPRTGYEAISQTHIVLLLPHSPREAYGIEDRGERSP